MPHRHCNDCGKPLGSTRKRCHECGGESIRADNAGRYDPVGGLSNWFKRLIGGKR